MKLFARPLIPLTEQKELECRFTMILAGDEIWTCITERRWVHSETTLEWIESPDESGKIHIPSEAALELIELAHSLGIENAQFLGAGLIQRGYSGCCYFCHSYGGRFSQGEVENWQNLLEELRAAYNALPR